MVYLKTYAGYVMAGMKRHLLLSFKIKNKKKSLIGVNN